MARPRSDISARILVAARHRFLKDGVDGASLRQIAAEARTNIGMIYYYFRSKDELFYAVVEEIYARLLADMEQLVAPDASVHERLRRLYQRLGEVSHEEAMTLQLVVREVLVSSTRLARIIDRFKHGHIPLLLGTVVEGQQNGTLRSDLHPALIFMAILALGAVPQAVRRAAGGQLPFSDLPLGAAFSDVLLEVLFRGVGGASAPTAKNRQRSSAAKRSPSHRATTRAPSGA